MAAATTASKDLVDEAIRAGMVTAPLLSLFIVPAVYALLRRPRL